VFDSTNIYTCFDNIEHDLPLFEAVIDIENFTAKILEIDIRDKYVLVSSKERVLIYLIEKACRTTKPVEIGGNKYGDY
jgi:hypothetical protein